MSDVKAERAQRAPEVTLILDYDGTLTPIAATPMACPNDQTPPYKDTAAPRAWAASPASTPPP